MDKPDAELEKLNAYLISKGKPPKTLNQNFVKANAKNVKKFSKQTSFEAKGLNHAKKDFRKICSTNSKLTSKKVTKIQFACSANKENIKCLDLYQKKSKTPLKVVSTLEKSQSRPATPQLVKSGKSKRPSLAAVATKKLVRRSILSCQNVAKLTPNSSLVEKANPKGMKPEKVVFTPKKAIKRKSNVHTEKFSRKKSYLSACKPKSKTPKPKQLGSEEEKRKRLEQLRLWMISKGKDPTKLCGFTPSKCVLTPVNSPAKDNTTAENSSQWPSLREEDYCNELSVLISQTMKEAQLCLEKDCSYSEVLAQLLQFHKKVSVCEHHASYWLTLALVYQKLNKNEIEVRSLYEKAIELKAEPLSDVEQALKDFVESQKNQPQKISSSVSAEEPMQTQKMSSPANAELSAKSAQNRPLNSPLKQSYFTKPIPLSPLVTAETPSSVIKLRMIPKSSPIFKKIVSRKALNPDVSGIVTPVRRSKRIENSKWSYPQGLLSQEKCVTTAMDLVEADESNESMSEDFVFDQNKALGEEFSDIQKVLQF